MWRRPAACREGQNIALRTTEHAGRVCGPSLIQLTVSSWGRKGGAAAVCGSVIADRVESLSVLPILSSSGRSRFNIDNVVGPNDFQDSRVPEAGMGWDLLACPRSSGTGTGTKRSRDSYWCETKSTPSVESLVWANKTTLDHGWTTAVHAAHRVAWHGATATDSCQCSIRLVYSFL
jgi:hypothetical protein